MKCPDGRPMAAPTPCPLAPTLGEVDLQTRVRDRYSFLFILYSLFFSKTISTRLRFIERIENKE